MCLAVSCGNSGRQIGGQSLISRMSPECALKQAISQVQMESSLAWAPVRKICKFQPPAVSHSREGGEAGISRGRLLHDYGLLQDEFRCSFTQPGFFRNVAIFAKWTTSVIAVLFSS